MPKLSTIFFSYSQLLFYHILSTYTTLQLQWADITSRPSSTIQMPWPLHIQIIMSHFPQQIRQYAPYREMVLQRRIRPRQTSPEERRVFREHILHDAHNVSVGVRRTWCPHWGSLDLLPVKEAIHKFCLPREAIIFLFKNPWQDLEKLRTSRQACFSHVRNYGSQRTDTGPCKYNRGSLFSKLFKMNHAL